MLNKDGGIHETAHGEEQRKRAGYRKDSRDEEERENSQEEEFTGGGGGSGEAHLIAGMKMRWRPELVTSWLLAISMKSQSKTQR